MTSSYVYFIQAGLSGPIKIGVSIDPAWRLQQLQTGNPDNLRLLAVHPGDMALEKALHRYFEPYRRLNEWFDVNEELLELIENAESLASWRNEHSNGEITPSAA